MVSCLVSMKMAKTQPVIDNFLLCCLVSNQKMLFAKQGAFFDAASLSQY